MDHYHSKPINGNAARVTKSASVNDEFESKFRAKNLGISYWPTAKPHIPIPKTNSFKDLTGIQFGRLTVVGFLGNKQWQCRCGCGYFVKRKSSAILKALDDPSQMCPECYELCVIKKRDVQRRTGKYVDWKQL